LKTKYLVLTTSIGIILIVSLILIREWAQEPYETIENVIRTAKTEQDVIEAFGEPYKIFYKGEEGYYIKGYSFKKRQINNKVMIYFPDNRTDMVADIILYVYIGNNGEVEAYFVGGS
jgi:hypothetical protein